MFRKNAKYAIYIAVMIWFSSAYAGVYEDFLGAIDRDDGGVVSGLLKRGLDPNTRGPNGQPALTMALQKPAPKVARVLLDATGTNLDLANENGESPLMMAALKGDLEMARQLIERGAQVNRSGWTPLHYAASGPSLPLLKLLLERGATIDAASPNDTTALMMAARYGTEDAVTVLLERGADPKRKNEKGLAAADFARLAGRAALTARLEALQK